MRPWLGSRHPGELPGGAGGKAVPVHTPTNRLHPHYTTDAPERHQDAGCSDQQGWCLHPTMKGNAREFRKRRASTGVACRTCSPPPYFFLLFQFVHIPRTGVASPRCLSSGEPPNEAHHPVLSRATPTFSPPPHLLLYFLICDPVSLSTSGDICALDSLPAKSLELRQRQGTPAPHFPDGGDCTKLVNGGEGERQESAWGGL